MNEDFPEFPVAEDGVDYGEVMHRFYAGQPYGVRGPRYEDITWLADSPQPSKEELAEKWETIKNEVALERVRMQRAIPGRYPSKEDLIIALWDKIMEDKHEYADELQALRLQIKEQFPKPE